MCDFLIGFMSASLLRGLIIAERAFNILLFITLVLQVWNLFLHPFSQEHETESCQSLRLSMRVMFGVCIMSFLFNAVEMIMAHRFAVTDDETVNDIKWLFATMILLMLARLFAASTTCGILLYVRHYQGCWGLRISTATSAILLLMSPAFAFYMVMKARREEAEEIAARKWFGNEEGAVGRHCSSATRLCICTSR
mmetsp:Transcript_67630/g.209236  ORF Transcript_67630/g.209236 Transcript_67630/m.209236 type:complete len:195 (+) Transcript_67630:102-686(+)